MNGRKKSYKEKQRIVEEFIEKGRIYETQPTLKFDLRGYAKYLKENNLSGKNIDESITSMFVK